MIHGPSDFIQKLLKGSEEERETLIGQTNHLSQFLKMLSGFVSKADRIRQSDISEQIENFPGIHELLKNPENLKQIILGMSRVTPLLYDLDHPEITNEHVHANLKSLNIFCTILQFLNQKITLSHELSANLKISLMELHLKIASTCEKFQRLDMLDPEYYECHLSIKTAAEHYQQAIKIYDECHESLTQEPFASKLWHFTIAKIRAHFGFCLISYALRNREVFEMQTSELRKTVNEALKNIDRMAIEPPKASKELIKELLDFPFKLNEISKKLTQPDSMIEVMFKEFHNTIDQLNMNYGIPLPEGNRSIEASADTKDILSRIQQLESFVEKSSEITAFIEIFKDDLTYTLNVAKQANDKDLLGLITLLRMWFRLLRHNISQSNTKYAELTLESLYLIRQDLSRLLSNTLPVYYIEDITDSLDAYIKACKTNIGSTTAIAQWIEGPEKEKPPTKHATKPKAVNPVKEKKHPTAKEQAIPLTNSTTSNVEVKSAVAPKSTQTPQVKTQKNQAKPKAKKSATAKRPVAIKQPVKTTEALPLPMATSSSNISSKETSTTVIEAQCTITIPRELKYGKVTILKHEALPAVSIQPPVSTATCSSTNEHDVDVNLSKQISDLKLHDDKPIQVTLAIPYSVRAFNAMNLLLSQGRRVYAYGGAVRDAIFNKPSHDMDLVSDCDEATFFKLFPHARKNPQIDMVDNYTLEANLSVTLVKHLDLAVFSKDRYLAAEALFADIHGQIYDPLNVYTKLCLENGNLAPVPNIDLIQSFKRDPSRIFRTIRTATHLQRAWSDDLHQAMITSAPKIKQLPFRKFLYQFSELFLRGKAALHFYICNEMGLIPHIALPLGRDSAVFFNADSHLYTFIKLCLMQIDHYPLQTVTAQNRLYLLALFLLPALEKARRLHFKNSSQTYSNELSDITSTMLDQYFELYEGTIEQSDRNAKYKQLEAIINSQLWPSFLLCRYRALEHKAMLESYQAPPPAFYVPINVFPNDGINAPFTTYIPYYQMQPVQQFVQSPIAENPDHKGSPGFNFY